MFKRFTKLTRDELSDLLKFLGEDSVAWFDSIENPAKQAKGWSSTVKGGRYRLEATPKSTEYDVRVLYHMWHNRGAEETITEKCSIPVTKSIPYQ